MAANSTTVTAPGTISPKVFWPLAVSVVLTFAATFLSAITPEMLGELGVLAFPMGLALGAVGQTISGWAANDELRSMGVKATAAVLPVYDQVTPPAAPAPEIVSGEVLAHEDETPARSGAHAATLGDTLDQYRPGGVS